MNQETLWGIDLGGTKIEGVILNPAANQEVLFRDRVPTEASQGYEHMISQICSLVNKMEAAAGYRAASIGIGTPGAFEPKEGVMKNCNTTALNGKPLRADLEKVLGMKVALANDANCFALAETRWGAVKEQYPDANVVFGVILGTGVGGGLVVNNKIVGGRHGIAGEWGHNFLDASGGKCYCGKEGCVETVLAGPALQRYYTSLTGKTKKLKDIMADLENDEAARKTLDRLTDFFGRAISVVVNIVDPDVIVIGGGVGNIDAIYTEGIKSLKSHIFNDRVDTAIVKPILGDSAGVFGAAFLTEQVSHAVTSKG